jgi:hypothetical protein
MDMVPFELFNYIPLEAQRHLNFELATFERLKQSYGSAIPMELKRVTSDDMNLNFQEYLNAYRQWFVFGDKDKDPTWWEFQYEVKRAEGPVLPMGFCVFYPYLKTIGFSHEAEQTLCYTFVDLNKFCNDEIRANIEVMLCDLDVTQFNDFSILANPKASRAATLDYLLKKYNVDLKDPVDSASKESSDFTEIPFLEILFALNNGITKSQVLSSLLRDIGNQYSSSPFWAPFVASQIQKLFLYLTGALSIQPNISSQSGNYAVRRLASPLEYEYEDSYPKENLSAYSRALILRNTPVDPTVEEFYKTTQPDLNVKPVRGINSAFESLAPIVESYTSILANAKRVDTRDNRPVFTRTDRDKFLAKITPGVFTTAFRRMTTAHWSGTSYKVPASYYSAAQRHSSFRYDSEASDSGHFKEPRCITNFPLSNEQFYSYADFWFNNLEDPETKQEGNYPRPWTPDVGIVSKARHALGTHLSNVATAVDIRAYRSLSKDPEAFRCILMGALSHYLPAHVFDPLGDFIDNESVQVPINKLPGGDYSWWANFGLPMNSPDLLKVLISLDLTDDEWDPEGPSHNVYFVQRLLRLYDRLFGKSPTFTPSVKNVYELITTLGQRSVRVPTSLTSPVSQETSIIYDEARFFHPSVTRYLNRYATLLFNYVRAIDRAVN